jgi:hypothetical protein
MDDDARPFPRIAGQHHLGQSDPSVSVETERMLGLYNFLVRQMSLRLGAARQFLIEPPTWVGVESAAQQLRHVLELILFSGLVAHRTTAGHVRDRLAKHDKDRARALVERINPKWFPVPFKDERQADGSRQLVRLTEGFLVADEWGPAWGAASVLLHARNPFRVPGSETAEQRHDEMVQLQNKLLRLLDQHYTAIPDGTMFVAQMQTESGGCRVYLFGPDDRRATE